MEIIIGMKTADEGELADGAETAGPLATSTPLSGRATEKVGGGGGSGARS